MSEIIALRGLVERLAERVQKLELNREFKTAPIMVSERETIADLVSLAALKFECEEGAIYGKGKDPVAIQARKWVCSQANLSRGISTQIIGWVLGRDRSTIYTIIHGKRAQRAAAE